MGLIGPLGRLRLEAGRGIVRESDCHYKLFLRQLISKSELKMQRQQLECPRGLKDWDRKERKDRTWNFLLLRPQLSGEAHPNSTLTKLPIMKGPYLPSHQKSQWERFSLCPSGLLPQKSLLRIVERQSTMNLFHFYMGCKGKALTVLCSQPSFQGCL